MFLSINFILRWICQTQICLYEHVGSTGISVSWVVALVVGRWLSGFIHFWLNTSDRTYSFPGSYQSATDPIVYTQTLSPHEYTEKVRNDSFTFSSARPNAISLFRHKPLFTCTQLSSCQWQHRFVLSTHIIDTAELGGGKIYPFSASD